MIEFKESLLLTMNSEGFVGYPLDKINGLNKSTDHEWWLHKGNIVTLTECRFILCAKLVPTLTSDNLLTGAHQIHCLGLVRQWIYRDQFNYDGEFTNTSDTRFHIHKNHCLLVLKTIIKCVADVTPVLFERDTSGLGAWKTRDAPHKCRRNDLLGQWIEEHKVCGLKCTPQEIGDMSAE